MNKQEKLINSPPVIKKFKRKNKIEKEKQFNIITFAGDILINCYFFLAIIICCLMLYTYWLFWIL